MINQASHRFSGRCESATHSQRESKSLELESNVNLKIGVKAKSKQQRKVTNSIQEIVNNLILFMTARNLSKSEREVETLKEAIAPKKFTRNRLSTKNFDT